MFKTRRNIVLALAVCALLLSATASVKNPVPRPFKLDAEHTLIVDLTTFPVCSWWIDSEVGEATHVGRFTASGEGTIDLSSGHLEGSGCDTAANGDKVFWDITGEGSNPTILIFTGGTGRFEGASGSFTITVTAQTQQIEPPLLIIAETFSGIGTITY